MQRTQRNPARAPSSCLQPPAAALPTTPPPQPLRAAAPPAALTQCFAFYTSNSAYGFWTDKGCRTWSSPCTAHKPTSKIETLSIRKPGTNDFTVAGKGIICAGAPDFDDGPHATPTDAACREHCLKGDKHHRGGGGRGGPPVPVGPVELTIEPNTVTHEINPLAMGCHSDSGYAHQARGFYSQMIVGDSFNATDYPDGKWNIEGSITAAPDPTKFHGTPSEKLAGSGGGISNRGLGNAGMVFQAGKEYEGFVFAALPKSVVVAAGGGGPAPAAAAAAAAAAASVELTVTLEDYVSKKVLATQKLSITGTEFTRYNFSLTPSATTTCVDIEPGSDPAVSCGHGKPRSTIGHVGPSCPTAPLQPLRRFDYHPPRRSVSLFLARSLVATFLT
eukprot:COSAG05_NODE_285_length_12188_cov_539.399537_7_plen_389_part_00